MLPFAAQHGLINKIQSTLERTCFDFVKRYLPDKLRAIGWDCPERADLGGWHQLIKDNLQSLAIRTGIKDFTALLENLQIIHDVSTKREPVSAQKLQKLLKDTKNITSCFEPYFTQYTLSGLDHDSKEAFSSLMKRRHGTLKQLEATLSSVKLQKAKLDETASKALEDAAAEIRLWQSQAGLKIERVVQKSNSRWLR